MTSPGHTAENRLSLVAQSRTEPTVRVTGDGLAALVGDGFEAATLYLVHGGRLRAVASHGQAAVRDGLPPALDAATLDALVPLGSAARLRVPVRRSERVVGVLDAFTSRPASSRLRVRALAQAYADASAGTSSAMPAQPVALRRFARHAVGLTTAASWDEAVEKLTDAALDLSGMSTAVVAVPDDRPGPLHTPRWRVCAAAGPLTGVLAGAHSSVFEALLGDVGPGASCWTTGNDESGLDLGESTLVGMAELCSRGVEAVCAVPLVAQGQTVGLLLVADDGPAHVGSTADAEVLELLGAVGAGALRTLDALQAVSDMATRDPLTGLGHHAAYFDDLRRALAAPGNSTVVVLTLDIDHFKQVNDTHGHLWGDDVLRAAGDAMARVLRGSDRAYRIGGDEFAAICTVEDVSSARQVGKRMLGEVRARLSPVTASLGLAVAVHGDSAESLTGRADAALYAAKRRGRDAWVESGVQSPGRTLQPQVGDGGHEPTLR